MFSKSKDPSKTNENTAFEKLYGSDFPLFCDHSVLDLEYTKPSVSASKSLYIRVCNGMELTNKDRGWNDGLTTTQINNSIFKELLRDYHKFIFLNCLVPILNVEALKNALTNKQKFEEIVNLITDINQPDFFNVDNDNDNMGGKIATIKALINSLNLKDTVTFDEQEATMILNAFIGPLKEVLKPTNSLFNGLYISKASHFYTSIHRLIKFLNKDIDTIKDKIDGKKEDLINKYLKNGRIDKLITTMGEIFECQSFGGFKRPNNSPYNDPTDTNDKKEKIRTLINPLINTPILNLSSKPDIIIMVEGINEEDINLDNMNEYTIEFEKHDNKTPVSVIYNNSISELQINDTVDDGSGHYTYEIEFTKDGEKYKIISLHSNAPIKEGTALDSLLTKYDSENYDIICGDFNYTKSKNKNNDNKTIQEYFTYPFIAMDKITPTWNIKKQRAQMNILLNNQIQKGEEINEMDGMAIFYKTSKSGVEKLLEQITRRLS